MTDKVKVDAHGYGVEMLDSPPRRTERCWTCKHLEDYAPQSPYPISCKLRDPRPQELILRDDFLVRSGGPPAMISPIHDNLFCPYYEYGKNDMNPRDTRTPPRK